MPRRTTRSRLFIPDLRIPFYALVTYAFLQRPMQADSAVAGAFPAGPGPAGAATIETIFRRRDIRLTSGRAMLRAWRGGGRRAVASGGKDSRMTPEQIALVQESFARVLPIRDVAAALFYGRLFSIDPSTRPLFRGDLTAQSAKLMAALATVVGALDDLEPKLEDIRALARRHVRYGVRDAHYASVGAALLWTLEQGLGDDWTPQVAEAWAAAYEVLSGTMRAAAAESLQQAA
jgi:nitric oxide dioxygenase